MDFFRFILVSFSLYCSAISAQLLSIDQFGAIPNDSSSSAMVANGGAIQAAFDAVANGEGSGVLIPDNSYFMVPAGPIYNVNDAIFQIDGTVLAGTNVSLWPNSTWAIDSKVCDLFLFVNASNLHITGSGLIDGQGYDWWVAALFNGTDERPNLLTINLGQDILVDGSLKMWNSPMFHIYFQDVINVEISGLTIFVDVEGEGGQRDLLTAAGRMHGNLPLFPLNTDGIDIAGKNVTIKNCNVTNYDDAYCVKPLNSGNHYAQCAEDYIIKDSVVNLGVGLTIGSVPPHPLVNCVRNVTFDNITSISPIKGAYVKPNPGSVGTGIIDSITYSNIDMSGALWWAIYVGTQQQDQPDNGANTGCSFFYPLNGTQCPPQPLVPVTNLRLINFTSIDSVLSPGILTCANVTGTNYTSCSDWYFENTLFTSISDWPVGPNFYFNGSISGTSSNASPDPFSSN